MTEKSWADVEIVLRTASDNAFPRSDSMSDHAKMAMVAH